MNRTQRDLLHLFFRRDTYRERIYLTREAYLAIAVVALLGLALFLAGAARFRESLGLAALRPPATAAPNSSSTSVSQTVITTTQTTTMVSPTVAANPSAGTKATAILASPVPGLSPRCPITWHVQEVAKQGGGRIGLPDDDQIAARVRQDFREAMQWADAPTQAWNLAEVDQYYTPRMANDVRAALQLSLNRDEYVQVGLTDLGFVSMSFTPDGAGVTFMSVQHEPITQTVRDASTQAVKRTVVLDDVSYRLVGIAMLYDTQACRWKIDEVDFPEPVKTP
jgi:hypothetical protein